MAVRSVFETYESWSVFKLITASVALEENITKTDVANDFYCNGVEEVADKKIQCWYYQAPYYSKHEGESLREALMHSCNPSFIHLEKELVQTHYINIIRHLDFLIKQIQDFLENLQVDSTI